jgi:hypothetical protein
MVSILLDNQEDTLEQMLKYQVVRLFSHGQGIDITAVKAGLR